MSNLLYYHRKSSMTKEKADGSVAFTLGPLGPTIPGAPCSPVVP